MKAIEDGKAAYMAGQPLLDNPYVLPAESTAWFNWQYGWHMARSLHEATQPSQKRPGYVPQENF